MSGETPEKTLPVDSKILFEKLFEFSPDAVLVTNQHGSILLTNAQTGRMFDYDRAELVGQSIELLIPERFRSAHPKHRAGYLSHPHTRPMGAGIELYGRCKDGREIPVDIMLSPLNIEGEPIVLAVVRDVTLGRLAEQERDRQTSLAREQAALLELAHDSIIVRDIGNRITFWNRGAEEKYGWKREEVLGKLAHTLLDTQFPQPIETVEETLRRDHYWEGEVVHKTKNGGRIVVASRRVLQLDAEGKPAAIFEINNDVLSSQKSRRSAATKRRALAFSF